jgi:hypothetical protein
MIKINKLVNLAQLDKEYNGQGLLGVPDEQGNYTEISLAENNSGNETELKIVLDKHIAIDNAAEKTSAEAKLAALGLTQEEIAALTK